MPPDNREQNAKTSNVKTLWRKGFDESAGRSHRGGRRFNPYRIHHFQPLPCLAFAL